MQTARNRSIPLQNRWWLKQRLYGIHLGGISGSFTIVTDSLFSFLLTFRQSSAHLVQFPLAYDTYFLFMWDYLVLIPIEKITSTLTWLLAWPEWYHPLMKFLVVKFWERSYVRRRLPLDIWYYSCKLIKLVRIFEQIWLGIYESPPDPLVQACSAVSMAWHDVTSHDSRRLWTAPISMCHIEVTPYQAVRAEGSIAILVVSFQASSGGEFWRMKNRAPSST